MKKKIQICIPTYNAADYVDCCLQSVKIPSDVDCEILVYDDGSTDKTIEIIEKFIKSSEIPLKIIGNTRIGLMRARAALLEYVDGDFIGWLDADDVCHVTRFEKQIDALQGLPKIQALGSQITKFGTTSERSNFIRYSNDQIKGSMFRYLPCANPSMTARVPAAKEFSFLSDLPASEDYWYWEKLSRKHRIINLREPLLNYRTHSQQQSVAKRRDQTLSQCRVSQERFAYYGCKPDDSEHRKVFSDSVWSQSSVDYISSLIDDLPALKLKMHCALSFASSNQITPNVRLKNDLFGIFAKIKLLKSKLK